MNRPTWLMAMLLAGSLAAGAEEVLFQAFDETGQVTFAEVTNATNYRLDWTKKLNDGAAWSSNAPGMAEIRTAGMESMMITVDVTQAFCLYRLIAKVTSPPPGMVLIPRGEFMMGNATNVFSAAEGVAAELPQHPVYASAFHMDQYEVTKEQWDEVASWAFAHGYDINSVSGSGKATNHPVHYVTWYECVKWCNARSEKDDLTLCYISSGAVYKTGIDSNVVCNWTANGYRLPTEAEWEKAARGGVADHRFPWSDSDEIQHARANYFSTNLYVYDTSPTSGWHPTFATNVTPYTNPGGSFAANGYELYDMAGNVWEWCWDRYRSGTYTNSPYLNPCGVSTGGANRVIRGGCWVNDGKCAKGARVSYREGHVPNDENNNTGFRCARRL